MSDLKPCPFCGEAVERNYYTDAPRGVWAMFHRCKIVGPFSMQSFSGETLAEQWNTRAPTDAQPETLAWAVVGKDGGVMPSLCGRSKPLIEGGIRPGERVVRVAIRIVEDEA